MKREKNNKPKTTPAAGSPRCGFCCIWAGNAGVKTAWFARRGCKLPSYTRTCTQTNWVQVLQECEAAKPLMTELTQIFHTKLDYDDRAHPHYHYVRPHRMDI